MIVECDNSVLFENATLFFPMHNYCFLKCCACGKTKILGCQDG